MLAGLVMLFDRVVLERGGAGLSRIGKGGIVS